MKPASAQRQAGLMNAKLAELVSEQELEALAGERAFERGQNYFADGCVAGLQEMNGTITARVRGTYYYRVKLWTDGEKLAFECSCPVGADRIICKHCVAVALTWLDRQGRKGSGSARHTKREVTDEEIRDHLMAQDKAALVDLVLEHTGWDAKFRDQLMLMTAQKGAGRPDVAAFRTAVDKAIRIRSFVDYGGVPAYARGIEAVIDSLEALLKHGHAIAVGELTGRALRQMETAMNHLDDSDGFMSGILDRFQDLHHQACGVAMPDPTALAKFLFDWEVRSDWEVFSGAVRTYSGILGQAGIDAYRRLAAAEWVKVRPLAPGENDPDLHGRRWRITHIMEVLAEQTGDVAELVAVKSRDLSLAFGFLQIAETYQKAGNHEAALEWAERGARAFPVHTDGRLRALLIEEYHRRERHDEAIAIAWKSFQERLGLSEFERLHKSARRAKQWAEWREKALTLLRDDIAARKKQPPKNEWSAAVPMDHSELVKIYLWEGDLEAAWNEAKRGGCYDGLWFQLAELRKEEYPEDAIAVYTAQLEPTLQYAEKHAYEEAVELLRKIQQLMKRVGKEPEFTSLVQSVRTQHKLRRNFMKLLDAEGW